MAIPWFRGRRTDRSARRLPQRRRRFLVEPLEAREMLSTFTVTSTADSTASGTLRWAITQSNANTAGPNTIDFKISGSGVHTINLTSALPQITHAVTIDGTSQTGSSASPVLAPVIVLNGEGLSTAGLTLSSSAAGSTIKGLVIDHFGGDGIVIDGGSAATTITEDLIGLNAAGSAAVANGGDGVEIEGNATDVTVSGNVISGNGGSGIDITGPGTEGNLVAGNFIGTDVHGEVAVPNDGSGGVSIDGGANHNTIGGTTAAARDVISGNQSKAAGVLLSASDNLVEGDYLGVDATGEKGLGNGEGVFIESPASGDTIGGTISAARNIISGNVGVGVDLAGASGNLIAGDDIGTDATGNAALGNGTFGEGVYQDGGSQDTIGGTTAGAAVVISANENNGLYIVGASGDLIEGDDIGTNAAGTAPLANAFDGIEIVGSSQITIGGTASGARDVISANGGFQVEIDASSGDLVEGDDIGTNATGSAGLGTPGAGSGVVIDGGATHNTIGGTSAAARDVISGTGSNGVAIEGSTSYNVVEGDDIGTNAGATAAVGNSFEGVDVGGTDNTIGGTAAGAADVISGNGAFGVYIGGSSASGNVVEGDLIGTDSTGNNALGNGGGVAVADGAYDNTIGGTATVARDIISGNRGDGVQLSGSGPGDVIEGDFIGIKASVSGALANGRSGVTIQYGADSDTVSGCVISGNGANGVWILDSADDIVASSFIGTNASGTAAIPNGVNGVQLEGGSAGNSIGGSSAAARDVISGNAQSGVELIDSGTSGNWVQNDEIGTTAGGSAALPNGSSGVVIQSGPTDSEIDDDVISGNGGDGVVISGAGTDDNVLDGDLIGLDAADNAVVDTPNERYSNAVGVYLASGASDNTVAFSAISGNLYGVEIGPGSTGNLIAGDDIGTDLSGTLSLGNLYDGVIIIAAAGNTVESNNIDNNQLYGIVLDDADENTITPNNYANNGDGSVYVID